MFTGEDMPVTVRVSEFKAKDFNLHFYWDVKMEVKEPINIPLKTSILLTIQAMYV
jgi:hypothetical protein